MTTVFALVEADRTPTARPAPAPANSFRILIVDDLAMNRDVAGSFLRMGGYSVICAEGGREAVAAAAETDFDLILMDIRMPGMGGLEATRQIRALPGPRGAVPIIALTAQTFAEQIADCRASGMDSHLAKPFTPAGLFETVARAIQTGRTRPLPHVFGPRTSFPEQR